MSDLIERLRKAAKFGGHYAEAADLIESQQATITELRVALVVISGLGNGYPAALSQAVEIARAALKEKT